MFKNIIAWFQKITNFGQYLKDDKVLNKGLEELKDKGLISGFLITINSDIKDDRGEFKKDVAIYVNAKTYNYQGYSTIKILSDVRKLLKV